MPQTQETLSLIHMAIPIYTEYSELQQTGFDHMLDNLLKAHTKTELLTIARGVGYGGGVRTRFTKADIVLCIITEFHHEIFSFDRARNFSVTPR